MIVTWVSCHDPADGIHWRCIWIGETTRIVVTGLPRGFTADAPRSFELPPGAEVHEVADEEDALDFTRQLGGVLFAMLKKLAQPPLMEAC